MKKRKEINNVTLYFASQRLAQGHAQRPQSAHQGVAMGQVREFLVGIASGGSPEQKPDSLDQTNTLSLFYFILLYFYLFIWPCWILVAARDIS